MTQRVVVTGMGVVAPNGNSVTQFEQSLREGRSGIRKIDLLEELRFGCQVAGVPAGTDTIAQDLFTQEELMAMSSGMRFASIAALEAWRDGGLERPHPDDDAVDWECGAVIGTGIGGIDVVGERLVPFTDAARVRRLRRPELEDPRRIQSGVVVRVVVRVAARHRARRRLKSNKVQKGGRSGG